MTAVEFYAKVIAIFNENGFNTSTGSYFYRDKKRVTVEPLYDGDHGYCFIVSSQLNFQWNCGRCFYNREEVSEADLLEKITAYAQSD